MVALFEPVDAPRPIGFCLDSVTTGMAILGGFRTVRYLKGSMVKKVNRRSLAIGSIFVCRVAVILVLLAPNLMNFRVSYCNSEECIHEIDTTRVLMTVASIVILAGAAGFIVNRLLQRSYDH